jgi:Staphylococcal nuclease homologue
VTVTHVVDGDTVDVSTGQRVRVVGIDTPERGECGYEEASDRMTALVGGAAVALVGGARDDVDRYGRILRYVDGPNGDAGRALIVEGLAIARYDSRDGYGGHPREADYVALDAATPNLCTNLPPAPEPTPALTANPTPSSGGGGDCEPSYPTLCLPRGHDVDCGEISARTFKVSAPDPYRLDADHDGIGCESN